jgi:hypothetical protein
MYYLGALICFVGVVWMTINAAKKDGALSAIFCFICGFYTLYYGIKNFAENKIPFLIWLGGIAVMVIFRPDFAAMQAAAGAGAGM